MNELLIVNSHEMAAITAKLDNVIAELTEMKKEKVPLTEKWLTNAEVCNLLKISGRLLQSYRDGGVMPFSQHGSKIYYKASDIENFLMQHYKNAFKKDIN